MLIISVLQNKQAETQAIFEHHNIRMIALKKSAVIMLIFSGICKEFGDSAKNSPILPIFFRQVIIGKIKADDGVWSVKASGGTRLFLEFAVVLYRKQPWSYLL